MDAPVALLVLSNRRILRCNTEAEIVFGWRSDELEGQSIRVLYPTSLDYEKTGIRWRRWLESAPRYDDDRFMLHRDGQILWMNAKGRTLTPKDPFRLMVWTFQPLKERSSKIGLLTLKEREVARHMVNGCTSKEIGQICGISPRTVETHRCAILKKLGARNVAELISRVMIPDNSGHTT